jgi:hypothetical protein
MIASLSRLLAVARLCTEQQEGQPILLVAQFQAAAGGASWGGVTATGPGRPPAGRCSNHAHCTQLQVARLLTLGRRRGGGLVPGLREQCRRRSLPSGSGPHGHAQLGRPGPPKATTPGTLPLGAQWAGAPRQAVITEARPAELPTECPAPDNPQFRYVHLQLGQ